MGNSMEFPVRVGKPKGGVGKDSSSTLSSLEEERGLRHGGGE